MVATQDRESRSPRQVSLGRACGVTLDNAFRKPQRKRSPEWEEGTVLHDHPTHGDAGRAAHALGEGERKGLNSRRSEKHEKPGTFKDKNAGEH
jgi:hypothetical protein